MGLQAAFHPRGAILRGAILLCTALAGCSGGPVPPPLHPVKGTVMKAGQAVSAGTLQFRSDLEPPLTTLADIAPDGSFMAATLFNDRRLPGARPGPYRITVILAGGADGRSFTPIDIDQTFTVEAKENYFTIDVSKAKKSP